jgi:hypothetical protein
MISVELMCWYEKVIELETNDDGAKVEDDSFVEEILDLEGN